LSCLVGAGGVEGVSRDSPQWHARGAEGAVRQHEGVDSSSEAEHSPQQPEAWHVCVPNWHKPVAAGNKGCAVIAKATTAATHAFPRTCQNMPSPLGDN
jgi:hypothetical protein